MQSFSVESSIDRNIATIGSLVFALLLMNGVTSASALAQPLKSVRVTRSIASTEVYITPTTMSAGGTSMEIAGDRWIARGYDLKTLIAQIYDVDARRIDFVDTGSTDALYDVSLKLPREVDEDLMLQMLRDALLTKFQLSIASENRSMDVYVLTAPNGPGAALHRDGRTATEQITYEGKTCSGETSGVGISAIGGTISEFRRTLEPNMDRLLIDETNLHGSYDFKIGSYANQQELFNLLHDHLGILVSPAQRSVTMLTVKPSPVLHAALLR